MTERSALEAFWELAKSHARLNPAPTYFGPTTLEVVPPPSWSFGANSEQADELLALVLDGTKTSTAGALWDFETNNEPLPEVGGLSIILDGQGLPGALIECTAVDIVPFDEVDDEHAYLEGEGDRSLAHWREVHERFFLDVATHDKGFRTDMPVVLERFRVLYAAEGAQPV